MITSVEYGRLLDLYLGLSAEDVEEALRRMLDGGDNELALRIAVAAEARYPNNTEITYLKEQAGDKQGAGGGRNIGMSDETGSTPGRGGRCVSIPTSERASLP